MAFLSGESANALRRLAELEAGGSSAPAEPVGSGGSFDDAPG